MPSGPSSEFFYGYLERRHPQMLTEIREQEGDQRRAARPVAKAISECKTEFVAAKGIKAA